MSNGNVSQALGYARAVFDLALDGWQKNLQLVADSLKKDPALLAQLNDPQTAFSVKRQKLDEILPADLPVQPRNFFYTLLKEGHLDLLGDIRAGLADMAVKGGELQIATVTTAIPLTDDEKTQFKTKLSAKYGSGLEFEFKVDEKIIGGVVVQVGDKILDGSIATRLDAARASLTAG